VPDATSTTSDGSTPIACAQCGLSGTGQYCSRCGSPLRLTEDTVTGEIGSKLTKPIVTLLSFIKTVWLVAFQPRQFYTSVTTAQPPLSDLSFPLSGLWRRVSSGRQRVMQPFAALATAIGLLATANLVGDWAWRITQLSERTFGMPRAEVEAASERSLREFYEQQFGQTLHIVNTEHLTGVSLVDGPAREIIGVLSYVYFPLVVLLFLRKREVRREVLLSFYVYSVSASLAVVFVCAIVGVLLFLLLQGAAANAAVAAAGVPSLAGYAARIYFVVVLPLLVFPKVLTVTRGRMLTATVIGSIAWMTANAVYSALSIMTLGVVFK